MNNWVLKENGGLLTQLSFADDPLNALHASAVPIPTPVMQQVENALEISFGLIPRRRRGASGAEHALAITSGDMEQSARRTW